MVEDAIRKAIDKKRVKVVYILSEWHLFRGRFDSSFLSSDHHDGKIQIDSNDRGDETANGSNGKWKPKCLFVLTDHEWNETENRGKNS